jgi:uncharacterized membrane protein YdfJ with MMPL/SSD domain
MTDPAALLTRLEQAKQSRDVWQIGLAEHALEHAAPKLAARVLELEAENKRLREGLDGMKCVLTQIEDMEYINQLSGNMNFERAQKLARAALKGGEI